MQATRGWILLFCAAPGVIVTAAQDVFAVIARLAKPGSVAGIARRTARGGG